MKKTEAFTIGLQYGLSKKQIENVIMNVLSLDSKEYFLLEDFEDNHLYEISKSFYKLSEKEPEEYVYKKAEFYGHDFYVDERVLIPRNETEILITETLRAINLSADIDTTTLIDIGTGSSCIPISLLLELKPLKPHNTYVVDVSPEALAVSHINREAYGYSHSIVQIQSSLLDEFLKTSSFDISKNVVITANLPYIKQDDFEFMDESVIKFEPDIALFGGSKTGFEFYEDLVKQCYSFKKIYNIEKITLFIEIGFDQYEISKKYLTDLGLTFEYFQDSNKIQRIIKITGF